jgi:tyrosyl-tRNA synthetase
MGQPPQQVFLVPLLIGYRGRQKMSKSLDNHIGITELPREIYGKVMHITDDSLIPDYFELVTDVPEEEIAEFKEQLKATPSDKRMDVKKRLAHEIVRQFHGKQAADEAQEYFTQVFQNREIPNEIYARAELRGTGALTVNAEVWRDITSLLYDVGLVKSRSEARRLLAQGAIEVDGEKVSTSIVILKDGSVIKVGKRRFLKIVDSTKSKGEPTNS